MCVTKLISTWFSVLHPPAIMLQRKMAAQELQPPDFQALEAARELRLKEMKMEVIIKEIIIYAFFVLVLFFISYQTRDSQSYMYASHLQNTFLTSSNGMAFDKVPVISANTKGILMLIIFVIICLIYPAPASIMVGADREEPGKKGWHWHTG